MEKWTRKGRISCRLCTTINLSILIKYWILRLLPIIRISRFCAQGWPCAQKREMRDSWGCTSVRWFFLLLHGGHPISSTSRENSAERHLTCAQFDLSPFAETPKMHFELFFTSRKPASSHLRRHRMWAAWNNWQHAHGTGCTGWLLMSTKRVWEIVFIFVKFPLSVICILLVLQNALLSNSPPYILDNRLFVTPKCTYRRRGFRCT